MIVRGPALTLEPAEAAGAAEPAQALVRAMLLTAITAPLRAEAGAGPDPG
jgi:hypothetical protein